MKGTNQMHQYTESELSFIQQKFKMEDREMDVFMSAAHRYQLNPLAMEIYPQIRTDRKTNDRVMSIATGINGYRVLADRTGAYAGNDDPTFDDEKLPTVATVTVYKVVGGVRCAFTATARWDQYFPGEHMGFMWRKMPHLMLGKVAEALALRKAFPAAIGGIYTDTEMEQAGAPINAPMMIDETVPVAARVGAAIAQPTAPPPAQRAVPAAPKAETKKASPPKTMSVEPKTEFVRLMGEWSKLKGPVLMSKCKEVMSLYGIDTSGKAEQSDFLGVWKFCEEHMAEGTSCNDAIKILRAQYDAKNGTTEE